MLGLTNEESKTGVLTPPPPPSEELKIRVAKYDQINILLVM